MTWYTLRLDLARTPEFPEGSAEHAYLLRLPLGQDDRIDAAALASEPERATVLRSLPDAPECRGYLVEKPDGWAFSYAPGDGDDEPIHALAVHPLRVGDYLTVIDSDAHRRPFRIVRRDSCP